jgi:hypothetical protein
MNAAETLIYLREHAPEQTAELEKVVRSRQSFCEACGGTGICGDEGPGKRNAVNEWHPCDCPLGEIHRSIPEASPEWKAEKAVLSKRIQILEDALNEIYHWTDSTSGQMEIINRCLPQK